MVSEVYRKMQSAGRSEMRREDVIPDRELLAMLLRESARRHQHLCPRQVLGVRLGLCGLRALGLSGHDSLPRFLNRDKRLLTFVETDGCGADGIAVAVGCSIGQRTMRVYDYGKVAATLLDTQSGRAVRVSPSPDARNLAIQCAPDAPSNWHAYLEAYRIIPDDELIRVQAVSILQPLDEILSTPDARVVCDICGEEIINEREIAAGSGTFCRSCAGQGYYRAIDP
jgi:formylmethanofuran dehydrogenase subunit E